MIFTFKACNLPLEIHCPKALAFAVSSAVDHFLFFGAGRYSLRLRLGPGDGLTGSTLDQRANSEVSRNLIQLKRWERHQVEVDVQTTHPGILSNAVGLLLVKALADNSGMLLHAAFLLRGGGAFLFAGRPRSGKSTLARHAVGMRCVHDDKVAVRREHGRWWAHGVPLYDSAGHSGHNLAAPISGLYLIERGKRLQRVPLNKKVTVAALPAHVIVPVKDAPTHTKVFENLLSLVAEVPCFRLPFRKDSDVSTIA